MNAPAVEGYEFPVGTRVYIAQNAIHDLEDVFPDPSKFDIDRYLPPRNEYRGPGYTPYGAGTHTRLGSRWIELRLLVIDLMIARYFTLDVSLADFELRFSPLPSLKLSNRVSFWIAERRRDPTV